MNNKVKTSVTIDVDVYEKLKETAEKQERSLSNMLNILLRQALEGGRK